MKLMDIPSKTTKTVISNEALIEVDLISDLDPSQEGLIDWTLDFFTSTVNTKKINKLQNLTDNIKSIFVQDKSNRSFTEKGEYSEESFTCFLKDGKWVSKPDIEVKEDLRQIKIIHDFLKDVIKKVKDNEYFNDDELKVINKFYYLGGLKTDYFLNKVRTDSSTGGKRLDSGHTGIMVSVNTASSISIADAIVALITAGMNAWYASKYKQTINDVNKALRSSSAAFPQGIKDIGLEFDDVIKTVTQFNSLWNTYKNDDDSETRSTLRTGHNLVNVLLVLAENYSDLTEGFSKI